METGRARLTRRTRWTGRGNGQAGGPKVALCPGSSIRLNNTTTAARGSGPRAALYCLVRAFADQAAKNLAKWGNQDMETLCLAIAEETGELAQAVLQARHEGGDPDRIRQEAIDLVALCAQMVAKFHDDN